MKKILIKINIVRKWLMSFATSPDIFTTLFHKKYYRNFDFDHFEKDPRKSTYWLGVKAIKPPSDFWVYQEILWETRPDIIIECGTFEGGSAFYLASICDLMKNGEIITIDNTESKARPVHPRIRYIKGATTDDNVIKQVRELVPSGKKVMAILDSNRRKRYVLKEMELYGPLVSKGCYLIVEDTHLNGHPIESDYGPGPMEAVKEFMGYTQDFAIDKDREKFLFSFNQNGYLKKVK